MTARYAKKLDPAGRMQALRGVAMANAGALQAAIAFCSRHGIGCFRVNSRILPLKTHPELGYAAELLGVSIIGAYKKCGRFAAKTRVRITFHPDQFVVINSPDPSVVADSLLEIEYQAELAEWIGADVINIHAGGAYGDKTASLERLQQNVKRLSRRARRRLCIENDDRNFTPYDLLPICKRMRLPMLYDVHHHRCNQDSLDIPSAAKLAADTWNREPVFHVSSPRDGWRASNPRPHHDYINLRDFPACFEQMHCTVEVEAKRKELAVLKLQKALKRRKRHRAVQRSA